jgi:hypothetical protein
MRISIINYFQNILFTFISKKSCSYRLIYNDNIKYYETHFLKQSTFTFKCFYISITNSVFLMQ